MSVSAVTTAIRALSVAAAATASPASDGDDGVPAAVVQEAVAALLAEPLPDGLVASFLATLQLLQPLPPPALLRACAEAVLAHAVRLDLPDEDDEDGEDDPVMEQSNGRTQEHSGGDGDGDGRTIKGPDAADTQEAQLGPTTRRTSPLVDIAGTGCSAAQAGALTTASALVAAACGLRVATLGGSSPAGAACAAEFMEALGAEVALGPEQAAALVQATGFVFLSSQEFHPCLRHVAAARSQLGMGSLFDLLGPVTHPAQPIRQVVGVSDARLGPVLAQLLKTCGARHVLVVHGQDGLDAISPAGNTQAWEVRAGLEIEQRMLEPQADFGVAPVSINDVHTVFGGSSMAERAAAFRRVLHGEQDLLRMVISMNAAAALYVGGVVDTLAQGVERATAAIDRGEVSALLVQYTAMTKALVSSRSPPLTFSIVAPQSPTKVASPLSKSVATAADGDSATPHATVYVSPQDTSAVGDDLRKPPASPSRLPVKPSAVSLDSSSSGAFSMPSRHPTHLSLSLPTAPSTHSLTSTSGPTAALLEQLQYRTAGGVRVRRSGVVVPDLEVELQAMSAWLDTHLGGIMLSDYEQPGRYSKWARGFVDPPLMVVGRGREFSITALNSRGAVLLPALTVALHMCADVAQVEQQGDAIRGSVAPSTHSTEESYSRQPSLFSVVRTLVGVFRAPEDQELGLQGAFGYDLAFQFEPLPRLHLQRPGYQRDMVLFIPDSILVWDSTLGPGSAVRLNYEFQYGGESTEGMPREGTELVFMSEAYLSLFQDHAPGQYAEKVRRAQRLFGQGSMVSCALSQSFFEPCRERPSALFARLRKHSPAPFTFLMNLGANDYVLGTSPDMFVRVQDQRVETCPISSTLRRGHDAITDAQQATKLLADDKVEAQLTLGADVDRNDKARICEPGSVKVLAHHRMEMSATFIRTFDHVEGILREEFDALDAFSVHAWPVSVTGAPKIQAMQFLEDHEASPRGWYGGAVGTVKFDGALNTGLSLQSIQIKNGVACVRVGTQLRWDSDPAAEEAAAALQAASVLAVLRDTAAVHAGPLMPPPTCHGCKVLVLDLHDAFVHTLVDYLKQTDAEVRLVRAATFDATAELDGDRRPTLVVLASGPGAAKGAELADTIGQLVARQMPILGVGLGLLGLVEFYGGELAQLVPPRSGQCTAVRTVEAGSSVLFQGLPEVFAATHYQTQQAVHSRIPAVLKVTAVSAGDTNHDPVVLAVEHQRLPIAAVQFQPTSIMTPPEHGVRLLMNVLQAFQQRARPDLWKPKSSAV